MGNRKVHFAVKGKFWFYDAVVFGAGLACEDLVADIVWGLGNSLRNFYLWPIVFGAGLVVFPCLL
jgi:hypothetical protein